MTFLPAQEQEQGQGQGLTPYLILDLFSPKIIGWDVHDSGSAKHAAHLARRTALAEGVHARPTSLVRQGDNGATMKATTVLAMLHCLGIKPSSGIRYNSQRPLPLTPQPHDITTPRACSRRRCLALWASCNVLSSSSVPRPRPT